MQEIKKVLLVDGNNLSYRNYYAQDLSTSTGVRTGLIYGVIASLLAAQREAHADLVIVVWDSIGGSTRRKALYPAYKGNRDIPSPDLIEQKETLQQLLHAMGVIQVSKAGVEADDIIGFLATVLFSTIPVDVVTNDKDIYQVISDRVRILHPDKGPINTIDGVVGITESGKTIWLRPEQVADFKAMAGDKSDNYPGLVGFGIGAAITYFSRNASVEQIIDQTADLGGLTSRALTAILTGRAMLPVFKELATLHIKDGEVAIPEKPSINRSITRALFEQLEFKVFLDMNDVVYSVGGKVCG